MGKANPSNVFVRGPGVDQSVHSTLSRTKGRTVEPKLLKDDDVTRNLVFQLQPTGVDMKEA